MRHQVQFVDRLHLASGETITVRMGYTLHVPAKTEGEVPTRNASIQFGESDRVNMLASEMKLLAEALLIGGYNPFMRYNRARGRMELYAGAKCTQPIADVDITQREIMCLQGGMRYVLNIETPSIKEPTISC